jgi:nickel transport protein
MRYALMVFLAFITFSFAHQINVRLEHGHAIVIKLRYPDGSPFAYEKYEIYSPDNDKVPFQIGRTDKLGRIVFIPNRVGRWRVKAISKDGHGINKIVNISETLTIEETKPNKKIYYGKIVIAILLIVFIYIVLYKILRGKIFEDKHHGSRRSR